MASDSAARAACSAALASASFWRASASRANAASSAAFASASRALASASRANASASADYFDRMNEEKPEKERIISKKRGNEKTKGKKENDDSKKKKRKRKPWQLLHDFELLSKQLMQLLLFDLLLQKQQKQHPILLELPRFVFGYLLEHDSPTHETICHCEHHI